jgi:hypothetical protein
MRRKQRFVSRVAVAVAVGMVLSSGAFAAPVAIDMDFLWSPDSENATQIYLHVSNLAYEPSRSQVKKIYPKLRHPEFDFPILVFMAHESKRSLNAVWKLRAKGMSWTVVMGELGIPRDRLFVDLKHRPGPPHGKAYGHWKKGHGKGKKVSITDNDIYYWVNVHTLSRYFDYQPSIVVDSRDEMGTTWKAFAKSSFHRGRGKAKEFNKKDMQKAGMEGRGNRSVERPNRKGKDKKK